MTHYASVNSDGTLQFYSTDFFETTQMPSNVFAVSDTQWQQYLNSPQNWQVVGNQFIYVPDPGPTLAQLKTQLLASLNAQCSAAILSGFTSNALNAQYNYPSTVTDQLNLAGSILHSQFPNLPANWTTPFWCSDIYGVWAMRAHKAAQIQQVGVDCKIMITNNQLKLASLSTAVNNATDSSSLNLINW